MVRRAPRSVAHRGWPGLWSLPLPDRRWADAALARRRLWRAVGAAEHAVARARETGAAVGDLDGLCRRLREAAHGADRSLAIGGRATSAGRGPEAIAAQVSELVSAAGQIQATAAAAAAAASRPAVSGLASDVAQEAAAVSAGIEAAGPARLPGLR